LLDGLIPRDLLPWVALAVRQPEKHAQRLCDVGLWEASDSGYRIHDYLEFQRSADTIRATRASDSERKRLERSGRSPNGLRPDSVLESMRDSRARDRTGGRDRAPSQEVEKRREERPPVVPQSGRQRERERFDRECAAYGAEHFPELDTDTGTRAIRQAVKYGQASTLEQVQKFVSENFPSSRKRRPGETG
jgi:hypothetical protein